jgi:uncharacterized membrane protein YeiB
LLAAVASIALSLMIASRWPAIRPVKALVATGQMAFTWYFAHLVLLALIAVMGWQQTKPPWFGMACGLVFFIGCTVASAIYKRRWKHGPLEWLMRRTAG